MARPAFVVVAMLLLLAIAEARPLLRAVGPDASVLAAPSSGRTLLHGGSGRGGSESGGSKAGEARGEKSDGQINDKTNQSSGTAVNVAHSNTKKPANAKAPSNQQQGK